MVTTTLQPEILIIGAGPGGSVAAWALAQIGHDVLLVDRANFPRDKTCGDGLPPFAVQTLRKIGVYPDIEAAQPARIERLRIVGPFGAMHDLALADYLPTDANYALVLPRLTLDEILRLHAVRGGAHFLGNLRIERIDRIGDRIAAVMGRSLEGPIQIQAAHVILATGANMGLLERSDLLRHKPQIMRAARAYYRGAKTPSDTFIFHYDMQLMPGYGWIFPTGDGQFNVGAGTIQRWWSTRKTAQTLLHEFVRRRAQEGSFAEATLDGPVKGFPLRIDFGGERVAGDNWLMIGETTGLVNPLSGEGIDLAMESGLLGAEIIHDDIQAGRANHEAYQRELTHRFLGMFNGLRTLRDILVTPFFVDYIIWLTRQHHFLAEQVIKINMGFAPPQQIFHPLFILQFFTPLSPFYLLGQNRQ